MCRPWRPDRCKCPNFSLVEFEQFLGVANRIMHRLAADILLARDRGKGESVARVQGGKPRLLVGQEFPVHTQQFGKPVAIGQCCPSLACGLQAFGLP